MSTLKHLFVALAGLTSAASADMLRGEDFDFVVQTYYPANRSDPLQGVKSGIKFSATAPPREIFPLHDMLRYEPKITLTTNASTDAGARYISFLAITRDAYGTSNGPDKKYHAIPWLRTNQPVDADGSLRLDHEYFQSWFLPTREALNATIHVWRQTKEVLDFLNGGISPATNVTALWLNDTTSSERRASFPPLDFPRANVDFRVRNETGYCRDDVDGLGNSLPTRTWDCLSGTKSPSPSPSASSSADDGTEDDDTSGAVYDRSFGAAGWCLMGAAAFALLIL